MCRFAAVGDLPAIGKYLRTMSKAEITELGIQLGLSFRWLKDHKSSETYRYDMVDAWLKKQDSVADVCLPSWQNLVATLREVDQNAIADQVTKERGTHKDISLSRKYVCVVFHIQIQITMSNDERKVVVTTNGC